MACLVLAGSVICILFSPQIESLTGKKDPSEIVADEFAGQAATYLLILLFTNSFAIQNHIWLFAVGGFALFRLFDIAKPWPIKKLEGLPAGIGILTDDLMAAIFAGLLTVLAAAIGKPDVAQVPPVCKFKIKFFQRCISGDSAGLDRIPSRIIERSSGAVGAHIRFESGEA